MEKERNNLKKAHEKRGPNRQNGKLKNMKDQWFGAGIKSKKPTNKNLHICSIQLTVACFFFHVFLFFFFENM